MPFNRKASEAKAGATSFTSLLPLNGILATGAAWHRTILTTANCASDGLVKLSGWSNAEDVVNVAVLLASEVSGATMNNYSGGDLIGLQAGTAGLNFISMGGLKLGEIKVEAVLGGTTPLRSTSSTDVAGDATLCNYNYRVVALG